MTMAIITKAKVVDKPVGDLISKIQLCKYYNWSVETYNKTSMKDIKAFKTYMELMSER
ncbi:MAG: hypothetical protein WC307_04970 [Candidatus Nanoarchaeia archaeon]|jgi:hypothetical protein